ncbi:hypothetical protein [Yinghuangia sp. YIM S09857]|uniref:hypothetical protein n=1 Tax=Yinghuangia sp. YIM S09857 TaxID=3436929 RepID=UPI003F533701
MDSWVATLAVAALGVAGTLASGLLTQRAATRARIAELEHDRRLRLAEEERARERALQDQRHACYVALNMADRQFHSTLLLHADALRTGVDAEQTKAAMEAARDVMREQWAEAQLVLPDTLLTQAAEVNGVLWKIYETIHRVERGHGEPGESPETATARLMEAKRCLADLRTALREELGVSRQPREP